MFQSLKHDLVPILGRQVGCIQEDVYAVVQTAGNHISNQGENQPVALLICSVSRQKFPEVIRGNDCIKSDSSILNQPGCKRTLSASWWTDRRELRFTEPQLPLRSSDIERFDI